MVSRVGSSGGIKVEGYGMRLGNRTEKRGPYSDRQGDGTFRRFRRLGSVAIVAAVVALTAAACSSSSSTSSSTSPSSSAACVSSIDVGKRLGHGSGGAEHQLLHRRHRVDDDPVQGADRGRDQGRQQPAGRGDPARHHVVDAVGRLRRAVPEASLHRRRIHLVAVPHRQRAGKRRDRTERRHRRHQPGRQDPDHVPARRPDWRRDREAGRVQGRHPDQLRPGHLPGLEHLLRQLRQRARG